MLKSYLGTLIKVPNIHSLGKIHKMRNISPVFSSGYEELDKALGTHGIPGGSIIEINGPAFSGKTTLSLKLIEKAQEESLNCLYIDADHSLSPDYAMKMGVKPQDVFILDPINTEQACETITHFIKINVMDLIVIDSLDALVSATELLTPYTSMNKSDSDKLLAITLKRVARIIGSTNTVLVFTTQTKRTFSSVYHNLSNNISRLSLGLHTTHCLQILAPINHPKQNNRFITIRITKNKFLPNLVPTELKIQYNNYVGK